MNGLLMPAPRLATYFRQRRHAIWCASTDSGIVDLSSRFAKDYPTLREAIRRRRIDPARGGRRQAIARPRALDAVAWQPPIPAPEKIICIGVNYPDRNAEYKDGSDAPKYPSMFLRVPRSFVGHNTPVVRAAGLAATRL